MRPLVVTAGLLGLCATVNVVDPNDEGSLGTCPFKLITGGLDCPGCGFLRATRALTRGDVLLAADHNVVFVLLVPLFAWGLASWLLYEYGRRPFRANPPAWVGFSLAIVFPVFGVMRNLPWFSWLASGAG